MSKLSEYIGSQFGNPRGAFGKICCVIMNIINRAMYISVANNANIHDNATVLDIGYGNGFLIQRLYRKNSYTTKIYGIDVSEDMLFTASKRNKKAIENEKVELLLGNCCDLPFDNQVFNVITSVNTIYFWPDTLKGLTEIHRVLKEDGVFYNAVYTKEWLKKLSYTKKGFTLFEKEQYVDLGIQAGFSNVSITEISSGKSYLIKYEI